MAGIKNPFETTISPMAFAAVPSVKKIGETIVPKTSDLARDWQTQQSTEPRIPGCAQPDLDCTVGAYEEPPFGVDPVKPAAHVLDLGTKASESCGLQIDVAEFDCAGLGRAHQPAVLPFDAAITDGAFGVVPDDELRTAATISESDFRAEALRRCDSVVGDRRLPRCALPALA